MDARTLTGAKKARALLDGVRTGKCGLLSAVIERLGTPTALHTSPRQAPSERDLATCILENNLFKNSDGVGLCKWANVGLRICCFGQIGKSADILVGGEKMYICTSGDLQKSSGLGLPVWRFGCLPKYAFAGLWTYRSGQVGKSESSGLHSCGNVQSLVY